VAVDNITPPFVNVSGYLDLTCPLPDGIIQIKNALIEAERTDITELVVQYVGAPKYRIKVNAQDYKTAEEELKKASDRALAYIKEHNGTGRYYREINE
jgi:translation initiation factor 2 subunit 1